MKRTACLILLVLFCIPFRAAAASSPPASTITVYADQVASAVDIEMAITNATGRGTHPGTVIFDGARGPFLLTADDKSINIFVSDLVLRGQNNAVIAGCDDGLFFDDFPLHDILIEELTFQCTGDGIDAPAAYSGVTIRHNIIQAGASGILIHGAARGWTITDNVIQSRDNAIWVINGQQLNIIGNLLSGRLTGLHLQAAGRNSVRHNVITAENQGVVLDQEAWNNTIQANTITGVRSAGISLSEDAAGNRILANRTLCAPGGDCQAVMAGEKAWVNNKINGNK
jgi:nitrous oxidase accessory protein NosD